MRPGYTCIKITGTDAARVFKYEAGGHRWQRIPPTEKRGRVQTSTITVAVLEEIPGIRVDIPDKDLEITTCRGSGKGGQHRNKTESAVQVKHIPTGLIVRSESERSQMQNKQEALGVLKQRLYHMRTATIDAGVNQIRKGQVGSGMRGDKVRTIRVRDGIVTNHLSGKKMSYKSYLQGFIEDLS